MAAIVMPPAADFNTKADKNIGCWLCQHFQRYDGRATPLDCEGECRMEPPRAGAFRKDLIKPSDWPIDGYWTYIPFGNVAWCNKFKRSLEENIPASPGDNSSDCPDTDPITWLIPEDQRTQDMFSKRSTQDSCWTCEAFQRLHKLDGQGPQITGAEACKGYCQFNPQPDYNFQDGMVEDKDFTWQTFPLFTKVPYAPLTWCSRWERSTFEVPPVPVGPGQIVCEDSGP